MPKKTPFNRRSDCPLSLSLEIFGDRWSLLIIRDLMFKDRHEYKDFLGAEEKIATNVLSERLKRLEEHRIVSKMPHPSDARKTQYNLTEKGLALAPVLVEMIVWAAQNEDTAAPPSEVRRMTKNRDQFLADIWTSHEAAAKRAR